MLADLLYRLHEIFFPFNVFRYITFRTALSVLTSAGIAILIAPYIIRKLRAMDLIQQIRDDGPARHRKKSGTPTMGGVIIIISIVASVLMWGDLGNRYIQVVTLALLAFGAIGFVDDYLKITRKDHRGLRAWYKFGAQIAVALAIGIFISQSPGDPYKDILIVPFFKNVLIPLGILYLPFAVLVMVGSSNAVNLTDGIDGLAIGLVAIATLANGVLIYISGHSGLAEYLHVLYLPGSGELAIFCGAMFGASLGFLWYNSYPADVFMGDVGSLGLGGALGTLAVISKHEIVLAVVGGIFVVETVSVFMQVISYKLTGKRIFRMAPLHHHFELKGWAEPKVIVRFWIIGILLALLSIATFKVR